jgi:hypothetical protein
MNLSPNQIAHIQAVISESNLSIRTLKDDLVDHLCCEVEYDLLQGKEFEASLQEAIHELAPSGFEKIEDQTLFLLHSTKIIYMKKVMYIVGLVSAISMSMGLVMKYLHWAGAQELTISGFLGFVLVFIPLATIDRFKGQMQIAFSERLRIIMGIVSIALMSLGVLLKIFHMDGANLSVLAGAIFFSFGFLPALFFNMYKKSLA